MPAVPTEADRDADLWNMHPRVGVGIIVVFRPYDAIVQQQDRFAWLHRAGTSHGNGQWSLPGGRLEFNETLLNRAALEVYEEIGIKQFDKFYRIPFVSEDFFEKERMHWITHYFIAYPKHGEVAKLMEPHKADALSLAYEPPGEIFVGAREAIKYANDYNLWLPE